MKKRPTRTEETLARLEAIRRDSSGGGIADVRAALGHERSLVVGRAAEVGAELGLDLAMELARAFVQVAAAEDDRECMATDAPGDGETRDRRARDVSLGAAHAPDCQGRRWLRGRGGAPLRAHAAKALVETGFFSALDEVAPMLADPEASVRSAAAEALGVLGGSGSAAVLRLKLSVGDQDSDVLGACLGGLLRVDVDRYLPTVAKYLAADDVRLVELAALALGESHTAPAFPVLRDAVDMVPRSAVATVLLALALLRRAEATTYLLETVERATPAVAAAAIAALALHKHVEAIAVRVRGLVETRGGSGWPTFTPPGDGQGNARGRTEEPISSVCARAP